MCVCYIRVLETLPLPRQGGASARRGGNMGWGLFLSCHPGGGGRREEGPQDRSPPAPVFISGQLKRQMQMKKHERPKTLLSFHLILGGGGCLFSAFHSFPRAAPSETTFPSLPRSASPGHGTRICPAGNSTSFSNGAWAALCPSVPSWAVWGRGCAGLLRTHLLEQNRAAHLLGHLPACILTRARNPSASCNPL